MPLKKVRTLIRPKSTFDLEVKLLLYKSVLNPFRLYGIQLWGIASPHPM